MRHMLILIAFTWSLSAFGTVEVPPASAGGGGIVGPGLSVDGEIMLWSGTAGDTARRASGTGVLKGASGVFGVGVVSVAEGGTGATDAAGALVNLGAEPTMSAANGSTNGYLTSANWTTFNNKVPTGANSSLTSLTGTTQIGIGQTSPTTMLDIKGTANTALTGTVSVTAGTDAVVGVGTNFVAQLESGSAIKIGAQTLGVASITDGTHLTLSGNHAAGAAAVTAYTDSDFVQVNNGAGNPVFALDKFGNLNLWGDLSFTGSLSQSSLTVGATDDVFTTELSGTTSCSDVACTGTGTSYNTELAAGSVIFDQQNNRHFFVRTVDSPTALTLVTAADFGTDLDNATIYKTTAWLAYVSSPSFTDGFSYTDNNDFFMDMAGRVTIANYFGIGPALTVTMSGISDGTALAVNGKSRLGQAGVAFSSMGACTVASNTLSTTATNLTCTGVPASASVAVTCSGAAAFSTPTASAIYCRSTGAGDQIACNTAVVNVQAMALNCMWLQP